jgi:hypothetical protein
MNNQLKVINNNVVGRNVIKNVLFEWLGFLSALDLKQFRMLEGQIMFDVSLL